MNEIKVNKQTIITILLASLYIVLVHSLDLSPYIKDIILPFATVLISILYLIKKESIVCKKAFLYLIPIILILLSGFICNIDISNKILNVFAIPILYAICFMTMTNKNYSLSKYSLLWVFDLFPKGLFSNLKFLKKKGMNIEKEKISKIILGLSLGGCIGMIIMFLLMSADAYFENFISRITHLPHIHITNILIFSGAFLTIFCIHINLLLSKDKKMYDKPLKEFDTTVVSTILYILNGIFMLFLFSEISKLSNNFLQLPGYYTYANYAREGFFQLLAVTIINFGIIFYLLYRTNITAKSKQVKNLLIVLILFSILLIFNSYYRMYLYVDNYGFTVLRMQVILFLFMEFIISILLIKKMTSKLRFKDAKLFFVIVITFYILNLYLCNETFLSMLGY